jgi:glycosyltransferase involved in cell wall biosynthesis
MITVSAIITTKNEAGHIYACLESIKTQSYKNIEILVVDNHSSDKTKEIARQFTSLVFDAGPERSAQRNFGARKAHGEYLLFLDADMILEKNVVRECIDKSKTYRALIIPEKSVGVGFWAKCKALERSFYFGIDWIEASRFFQKDIFDQLKGYDTEITGPEDYDLPQRLKETYGSRIIGRISAFIEHNEGSLSFRKTLQKKYYYAHSFHVYRAKTMNADYVRKQSNIFLRYWLFFRHPEKLFAHPMIGLGMLFLKTAEFFVGAFGSAIR